MNFVVARPLQVFDRFKSVPYPYSILGPEHPVGTLGESMFAGYYVWDVQAMWSATHTLNLSHSHSILQTTGGGQATQPSAVDERITAGDEDEYVSVKTF